MLVTIFCYMYKQVYTSSIYLQSMKKIKGHFCLPSTRPTRPSHQTRGFAPRCEDAESLGPGGKLQVPTRKLKKEKYTKSGTPPTPPPKLKFYAPHFPRKYTQKQKSHLIAINLKILTSAPNLTSNFETPKKKQKEIKNDTFRT